MEPMVVVGYDGSARSRAAAHWAAGEAARRQRPLRLVHVAAPVPARDASGRSANAAAADRLFADPAAVVAELYADHPAMAMKALQVEGSPAADLIGLAAVIADLLVLGIRGAGGWAGLSIGSVALEAAERCPVPVVLVPIGPVCRGAGPSLNPVTLAIDAHAPADAAVDFAFDVAQRRHERLRAVHVGKPGPPEAGAQWLHQEVQTLVEALRPWRHKYPDVRVVEDVVLGLAVDTLARASGRSELLVVGRCGSGLGSVVRELVGRAEGPIAVVPA